MNPTNERKTRGDLVHQIVTVLVKNNAQVTPDTAWVHDFTELITAHTNAEIAKAKLEAFDVAFDCHDYDRLREYRAELLKEVK